MPLTNWHSARVKAPDDFLDGKDMWATIEIKPGINLITGKLKKDGPKGPMTAQSYRFDMQKFTVDQAKKWLKKHKVKPILFEPGLPEKKEVKETSMIANIAPRMTEKCWGSVMAKKRKKIGLGEQKGDVVAVGGNGLRGIKGSFEDLRDKLYTALKDSQLYGKYPDIVSTFPKKIFVSTEDGRYFEVPYSVVGDEVKLSTSRELEKQVKFLVKEWAEEIKTGLFVA
jgi:hypothetical protein